MKRDGAGMCAGYVALSMIMRVLPEAGGLKLISSSCRLSRTNVACEDSLYPACCLRNCQIHLRLVIHGYCVCSGSVVCGSDL